MGESLDHFSVIVPPVITSFAPGSGPAGTEVTLSGTDFSGTTEVSFNGMPASTFTVDSDAQIRAVVPVGATTGLISATNAADTG